MGLGFELFLTLGQIITSIVMLVLSRHEKPHEPLRTWIIGYLSACAATLPFFFWLFPFRSQGVVSVFQEMQVGKLKLSFTRCHGSVYVETPAPVFPRLKTMADCLRIMLYFFFLTWFVLGCVWISVGSSRADAPKLYWSCISFLITCGLAYVVSFGFVCAALCCCCPFLCCPCLVSLLALIGLAETEPPPRVIFSLYDV